MYRRAATGLAILMAVFPIQLASADDQSDARTFTLHHMKARDAATVVRTIVGIRQLAVHDDQTLEITAPEASLQLTTELLAALDASEIDPSQSFTTGDETVVAVIPLVGVSSADAMAALRRLKIQRMAASAEPAFIVVRDSFEQVALAIEALDEASSQQQT